MRLFVAIQLSDDMKDAIGSVQEEFRDQGVKGNYTSRENMHMTLAFIGEYGDPDEVLDALGNVEFNAFNIEMGRVGNFTDLWWTGISENKELNDLVKNVRHILADSKIPFDKKRFMPHITFLRKPVYTGSDSLKTNLTPTTMKVDHISLMCSTRGKNGMIYTEIGRVSAQGDIA